MYIIIIDYKIGNLLSVQNMFKYLGVNSRISNSIEDIKNAEKLILPGVGHFKIGMENLIQSNLLETLSEEVLTKKKPILGICLGMQLMTKHSEEGDCNGLGWLDATTRKFQISDTLKVPHMGWNDVHYKKESKLTEDFSADPRYYFVHSYHVHCNQEADVLGTTTYGYEFVAAFQHENIYGVQFHPEKSHKYGMELLRNFNKI
jgi:glutamine amidotransferase